MRGLLKTLPVIVLLPLASGCGGNGEDGGEVAMEEYPEIAARMEKYALTPMEMDLGGLTRRNREMLEELLEAAALADEIYWRQTSHVALPLREEVQAAYPEDHPLREFFMMQAGPYDRLDHDEPFMEDVPPRAPGGGFYPRDLTAEEFHSWIEQHPEDREAFLSPYTVIKRSGEGLVAIPYHEEYAELVGPLAEALRRAAELTDHEPFARYLRLKADAVLDDQYYDADTAWVKMSGNEFDITIGPFEVYGDELLGIKAAYEASVEIVDQEESARLEVYKQHLAEMEANLPYADRYKPESSRLTAAFTIVRDIYRGGDIRVGYQPVAANLPNDPRVHSEVGSKRTFWKNMFEARLDRVILPISRELVAEDQVGFVTPQGFFDVVLLHEIAHGLGARYAETESGRVAVNQALTTHYSWIEEAKATVAGLESLAYLVDAGVTDQSMLREYYASYLGSIFRTIRFGTGEAHGLASLVELNYFLENGGVRYDSASGRFAIEYETLPARITDLARDLLTMEARGDVEAALSLRERHGEMRPEVEAALDRVADVPVDPVPVYRNIW